MMWATSAPSIALPLHDERLGPDALLRRRHLHLDAEDLALGGVLEPLVVHHGDPVARAEDHVDEARRRADLGQPVGEDQVRPRSRPSAEASQQPLDVARADEDVEVLGGAVDAGLMDEGERPADQERDAGADRNSIASR